MDRTDSDPDPGLNPPGPATDSDPIPIAILALR